VIPPHSERGNWEWAACGASVTGSEHLRRGLGCDDAYGYALNGDFVVAVVADGAGSVTGTSAWGSYAACQSVLNRVFRSDFIADMQTASEADADAIMRRLFEGALERVGRQAECIGVSVPQLATTLCVAVATPKLTFFGQIGDGIIVSEIDGGIDTHLIEEKSEYANATWFLQSDGAFEESFRTSAHTGLSAFALSTDGMAYKITNIITGKAYEPFFTCSWQNVRSGVGAAEFAAALRGIKDDQTGDDKTMVLAALQWADDAFYPSTRPICTTVVSSPPPASVPGLPPGSAECGEPEGEAVRDGAYVPESDARSIVDHGMLIDDTPTAANGISKDLRATPSRGAKRKWRARHRRDQ
jgi:hypothetical protein